MHDKGDGKQFNPSAVLLSLDHRPLDEVEALGAKLYSDIFLDTARDGRKPMHDGGEARFYPRTFKHAFFKSPGEMIQDDMLKRAYLCFSLGYIVWLKKRDDGCWCFLTAYNAPAKTLRWYLEKYAADQIAVF